MKFTCSQQELSKALGTVSRAVSSRTTLPVLKGILITAENDTVILTASNLDLSIRREIDAVVEEPGAAVAGAKLFGDIIRKLPGESIRITAEAEGSMTIQTSSSEFTVVTMAADEFPEIGKREENDHSISFNKDIFRSMVRRTAFAASIDEAKGVLTGILTEIKENDITMVALDGFRLALTTEQMKSAEERSFIISARIMSEIARTISEDEDEEDLTLYLGEKMAVVKNGRIEMILRLMEGEFIRYKDIIPTESTTRILINRSLFLDSIERASLLAREGKNNLVRLSIAEDMMRITSRSEEGNVREEIPIDKEGGDLEIGFNSKYVMDVLKEIEDETIALHMRTGVTPCVVRPTEGNLYEYLILPVRIPSV